jgi:hypothetical protein
LFRGLEIVSEVDEFVLEGLDARGRARQLGTQLLLQTRSLGGAERHTCACTCTCKHGQRTLMGGVTHAESSDAHTLFSRALLLARARAHRAEREKARARPSLTEPNLVRVRVLRAVEPVGSGLARGLRLLAQRVRELLAVADLAPRRVRLFVRACVRVCVFVCCAVNKGCMRAMKGTSRKWEETTGSKTTTATTGRNERKQSDSRGDNNSSVPLRRRRGS